MKTALILTLGRIVICPLFLVIYLFYTNMGISVTLMPYLLLLLLLICELSDAFDGFFARRQKQVTELGKILDPMADSIVRVSVFLTFTQGIIKLPLLLVLVFVVRDSVISTLRTLCALRGVALAARMSGKLKAVLQAIAIFAILFLMIPYTLDYISLDCIRLVSFWIVFVTAVYTVLSGVEYLWFHRDAIKQSWKRIG
ncbi:MAG: CDP-diacylglycerol--glycerol-3-phosphate 3-phosphatidyltransferase [Chlamydiae bacterium]|nr:CDP-diacylglycerol--glycerol-3-phosphate 3-phosphatidyltransferase [Chlamydiota bacterium]